MNVRQRVDHAVSEHEIRTGEPVRAIVVTELVHSRLLHAAHAQQPLHERLIRRVTELNCRPVYILGRDAIIIA